MHLIRKNYLLLLLLVCVGFACQQQDTDGSTEKADAILEWSGEYMVDGCGFRVLIDDKAYKPENEEDIAEAFKTEAPTPVVISFVRLNEQIDRRCGLATESKAMDGIRVVSVTKR